MISVGDCIIGCFLILQIPHETLVEKALNATLELEPYIELKTFVFIPYDIAYLGLMLLFGLMIMITIMFIVLFILLKKKVSGFLKHDVQRWLIMSAIIQIVETIFFVLLPFGWMSFYLLFQIQIGGRVMLIFEIFVASHAVFDYVTTLYVVMPYRKFVQGKFAHLIKRSLDVVPDSILANSSPSPVGTLQVRHTISSEIQHD